MSYDEAVRYLQSFNNMPRGRFAKYDEPARWFLDYRTRMRRLFELLGHPEKQIPHYIHVTGTSGKGSVVTYLESVLRASGKKTGHMISPHPTHVREEWQIGGRPLSRRAFVRIIEDIRPVLDQFFAENPRHRLSLFHLEMLIGFVAFAREGVEWAVIEVGMGGRHDSTNILPHKDAVVITTIGRDHMQYLGNTTSKIAYQKAGIIARGSDVFTGPIHRLPLAVIDRECKKQRAIRHARQYQPHVIKTSLRGTDFDYGGNQYHVAALGSHQVENAALVIDIARHIGVPVRAIQRGLSHADQPIRMEVVKHDPTIILDGAHNADKMKSTVETLRQCAPEQSVHLVIGFSGDKEWRGMLRQLATLPVASIVCTRNTSNPFRRVVGPAEVAAYARRLMPSVAMNVCLYPPDAYAWSRQMMQKHDILLVTGSIFLSGELRPLLTKVRA